MIPKHKFKHLEQENSSLVKIDTELDVNPPIGFNRSKCQECNYNFGFAKNRITLKQYIILLKDETEYKSICSKCLNVIDDNSIKFLYTYEEFQKRINDESN